MNMICLPHRDIWPLGIGREKRVVNSHRKWKLEILDFQGQMQTLLSGVCVRLNVYHASCITNYDSIVQSGEV